MLIMSAATAAPPHELPGYTKSPHFDEQIKEFTFDPDVLVHINAPAADKFDPALPVRLVVFALPNGNTIPQTIGCRMTEGRDWHFDIQHIGAQTRLIRTQLTDANLVVAYVQAKERSWPNWRKQHEKSGDAIAHLIEGLAGGFFDPRITVELTAHSGGGSMIFGLIEQLDEIPDLITLIAWLDANYNFTVEKHAAKLTDWLNRDPNHVLAAICYDDRDVTLDGKPVVSPTGGTFRRTQEMATALRGDFALSAGATTDYRMFHDELGRIELILLNNPDGKILHTVLVERNGFIHALTLGTPQAGKIAEFWGDRAYSEYIQPSE
jgi:hypothetical protein